MRSSKLILVLGLGGLIGAGSAVAAYRFVPQSPLVRGLYIGEHRAPERVADAPAWLAARRDAALARSVRFFSNARTFHATLAEAGVTLDVVATLARAAPIGHTGAFATRLRDAQRARRGRVDVPLVWSVDEAKARALLATYAPELARGAVNARLDLDKHLRVADVPGQELDVEASLARLRAVAHDDDEAVELAMRAVPAKVTLTELAGVDVEKVVSAYETTFTLHGTGAGRAINIRTAAERFDGTVLASGEVFSFNDKVGPRTKERGFALAPEIQGDELTLGYGGGTCQASSTLYAAALFGALEIVDRQSHSRPSSYMKMGLDATVSFPLADLKIKNTLPYPIILHAYFPKPTSIRVELLGGDPIAKVDYAIGVSNGDDFIRRVTVKHFLPAGTRIRHQKGSRGFDVMSIVKVSYFDGRLEERKYVSPYRPTPEVFWVSPGFDAQELPPLPDHAKGVEGAMKGSAAVNEPPVAPIAGG